MVSIPGYLGTIVNNQRSSERTYTSTGEYHRDQHLSSTPKCTGQDADHYKYGIGRKHTEDHMYSDLKHLLIRSKQSEKFFSKKNDRTADGY